ncbi:hypothetical protein, partial [Escherichia coli]|uniref:hypothetical protein n=1 Tax=Escherichia coli TaxID=562 RepID=UPI001F184E83
YGNQPEYSLHYLNTRNTGIENPRVLGSIPSPAPLFIRPRCKAGLFHFLATVDFWPLQSIIYWLVFFAFSRMFVTFIHLSTL